MCQPLRRFVRSVGLLALASALVPACLDRPLEPLEPDTTTTFFEGLAQSRIDKIDILLSIDNSGSMADKQEILAQAVPRLVEALVNPPCLGDAGEVLSTPASPVDPCPAGTREFQPVLDIHIGVVSTSLGSRGSASCVDDGGNDDDDAHLISRTDPVAGDAIPTYGDKGFLVWRPNETSGSTGLYSDVPELTADLEAIVQGVGEDGCGYEAQLESWYRFLVDPSPYETVEPTQNAEGHQAASVLAGTDDLLLEQRRAFLRPDSLVAILMLSDENDCSFRAEGYGWLTGNNEQLAGLKARAICKDQPQDPCCTPCGQAPEICPADPSCTDPAPEDHDIGNLTCFDQKRRFGVDLLYPMQRYVDGLTRPEIADRDGQLVNNPLFLSETGLARGRDRIFLAGIVGVPWQLIARNPADLVEGFQNAAELTKQGTWDAILGDPANAVPPSDPHMHESIYPRPELPGLSAGPNADPIIGHDYRPRIETGWGDLQHACVFDLPESMQITCDPGYGNCNCNPSQYENNPLCQAPDGSYGDVQYRAKGYPGLRQLGVLKAIGDQAIVGSICPAQMSDTAARDYGYRPAVDALIERLKSRLRGLCLQRSFDVDAQGQVACVVLEGTKLEPGASCDCASPGRSPVKPEHQQVVAEAFAQPVSTAAGLDCMCAIDQLAGEELAVCQSSTALEPELGSAPIDGWCYVDATSFPPIGNPELVEHCQQSQERTLRFVGAGEPDSGATAFILCQQ